MVPAFRNDAEEIVPGASLGLVFPWDLVMAITFGMLRARRVAVQGSPLRSDRVLRTRLARVPDIAGRTSSPASARP